MVNTKFWIDLRCHAWFRFGPLIQLSMNWPRVQLFLSSQGWGSCWIIPWLNPCVSGQGIVCFSMFYLSFVSSAPVELSVWACVIPIPCPFPVPLVTLGLFGAVILLQSLGSHQSEVILPQINSSIGWAHVNIGWFYVHSLLLYLRKETQAHLRLTLENNPDKEHNSASVRD